MFLLMVMIIHLLLKLLLCQMQDSRFIFLTMKIFLKEKWTRSRPTSSSSRSRPIAVSDDVLVVHQIGDAGDRLRLERERVDQRLVGRARRRDRDRIAVVDVVGEPDHGRRGRRAADRVADDRGRLGPRGRSRTGRGRVSAGRRRGRRRRGRDLRRRTGRRRSEYGCVTGGFIERLAAARIGATYNFYRDGDSRRVPAQRLAAYLDARAGASMLLVAEAPGYRGTRVSGIPLTSERQLTGAGPAEATATVVHAALAELGARGRRAALERRADPSRRRDLESPADARRDRGRTAVRARTRARTACGRRSGGSRTRRSAARTSGIPAHGGAAAFRRRPARSSLAEPCLSSLRVAPGAGATRSCSRRGSSACPGWSSSRSRSAR